MKFVILSIFFFVQIFVSSTNADSQVPELATHMGELQRITHKLTLATLAKNKPLAKFYLHESIAKLEEIQNSVPVYEDIPVAIMIDRQSLPNYETLSDLLKKPDEEKMTKREIYSALENIIGSCNDCHVASKLGFIEITLETDNPFNQKFAPR